jgi:hypothetical protein
MPEPNSSDEIGTRDSASAASSSEQPPSAAGDAAASTRETPGTTEAARTTSPDTRTADSIPLTAHERILDRYHQQLDALGWASGLDRDRVQRALALAEEQDRARHTARDTDPEPQPDAKDDRGESFYSPKQAAAWAEWKARGIVASELAKLEQRFGPIERDWNTSKQLQKWDEEVAAHRTLPGFEEHLDAMTKYVADFNERRSRGERLPVLTLRDAYLAVVVPKLAEADTAREAKIRKEVLAELQTTHDRAGDGVNPSRTTSTTRKPFDQMTTKEIVAQKREEAEAAGRRGSAA